MPRGVLPRTPVTPDATLRAIIGEHEVTRAEVTQKLWAYINTNAATEKKGRDIITTDEKLVAFFGGVQQVNMFQIQKFVSEHLVKVEADPDA